MEPDDYQESVLPSDEIEGTDIKLNPQYYIHVALLKAQGALDYIKEDPDKALMQFRFLIEHTETLAKSANLLSDEYEADLKKFKGEIDGDSEAKGNARVRNFKLADKKLNLIMKEVFKNSLITAPLKA